MSLPTLTPTSQTSKVILPSGGTPADVAAALPFGLYSESQEFLTGASEQVAYTYKTLGGDVLDLEITAGNVYANYQASVMEYSYILNIHQSKNVLSDLLGSATGTFDHDGQLTGSNSAALSTANLKYPRFNFSYAKKVGDGISHEAGVGGTIPIYSASFDLTGGVQDYDLQEIISSSATDIDSSFYNKVGNKRAIIRKVFYKTPQAMWRFFGYYGGLNVVGNLLYYCQYTDDSTFEIIPVWQNKAQAQAYEDHLWTRLSHYSYELKDNRLRIFPEPQIVSEQFRKMWVEFSVQVDPLEINDRYEEGIEGVNNMNTIPFENLPFEKINSTGKQWIRRYALALSKETLGQIRSKLASIPIPGESVTLNGPALLTESQTERDALREELKTILDEMTYAALAAKDAEIIASSEGILNQIPMPIFQG